MGFDGPGVSGSKDDHVVRATIMLTVDIGDLVWSISVKVVKSSGGLVWPMPGGLPDTLCHSPRKYSGEECTDQRPQS